jgi:heme/copper-type cytochrome/quinol oxidase subunit 4
MVSFWTGRKKDIIFTNFAIATGITFIELLVFFLYFRKLTQNVIDKQLDGVSKLLGDAIINTNVVSVEDVYIYEQSLKPVMVQHLNQIESTNRSNAIKSIVLVLALIVTTLFIYLVIQPTNIPKAYISILFGIALGSIAQYMFIITFVLTYNTKSEASLFAYALKGLENILTSICPF